MAKKNAYRGLRVLASILANATAILSANFIVFYILDHYNPGLHFIIYSTFFLTEYLHVVLVGLALLTGLLYLLLFTLGAFDRKMFSKKRLIRILIVDVAIAAVFAITVNTISFDWLHLRAIRSENIVTLATPTPEPTLEATAIPTASPSPAAATPKADADMPEQTNEPTATPEPTPEPTATPIPGLLGDKFADKFTDGDPVISKPNVQETMEDGTVKTLVYTYASDQVVVELTNYSGRRVEYQVADLYLRNINSLMTNYVVSQSDARMLYDYARNMNAIIAINGDYFVDNATNEGLIIRNRNLLQSKPCRNADLCVIYQDGTMRCYDCKTDTIDIDEILAAYPYHSFYFGPSLLDADGNAKTRFNSSIGVENPRTVIGYFEPGHYAFISVLGDRSRKDLSGRTIEKSSSHGMTFAELSELCASMGMTAAYNLDGGASSGMFWNETLFGHNARKTGDIIAIIDPR